MSSFARSIIHTLAFYDAVGRVPLTVVELYKHLIDIHNTQALEQGKEDLPSNEFGFGRFISKIETEWPQLQVHAARKNGLYFLKKNRNAYEKRIDTGKTGIKKWRAANRIIKLVSFLPFIRMVAVTGSLALNSTRKESDIDVLIVSKSGFIWTTRILVSSLVHLLGKRRYGKKIEDRVCLNHYIAETDPAIQPQHLFSAHICSSLVPIYIKNRAYETLIQQNAAWVKSYLPHFRKKRRHLEEITPKPRIIYLLSAFCELLFAKTIANLLEELFKRIQIRKIQRNIKQNKAEERDIIFDDKSLVFHHPRPRNQTALILYKKTLKELSTNYPL